MPNNNPNYLSKLTPLLGFIGLILLVTSLTYRFVEVPARNFLNARYKK
jgi:peptidoglycan/LPS O-acetylase OafA/YrhL